MTFDPWVDADFDRKVRETAYFLWENAGQPPNREREFWFVALERCLREREADRLLMAEPPPKPDDSFRL